MIGDGASVPDGEVEGLDESDFLELYRQLVLLRTYDERSVVYHRQGRSARTRSSGATRRCRSAPRTRWSARTGSSRATVSRRSASCAGCPPATVLSWWRGHPSGWWNPLDYNVASICVPIATQVPHAAGLAWGKKLRGERTVRARVLRRRRDLRGRVPRGRELRRRDAGAAGPALQQQPVGDLDAALGADGRADARRQGDRLRHARRAGRRRATCSRSTRRRATRSRGRARATGRPSSRRSPTARAARDRRRPERLHRPGAGRGGEAERVRRAVRAVPAAARRARRRDGGAA